MAEREHLHAEATVKNGVEKRITIVFEPEDGAIGFKYVFNAHSAPRFLFFATEPKKLIYCKITS